MPSPRPKTIRVDDELYAEFSRWFQTSEIYPRHAMEALMLLWLRSDDDQRAELMKRRIRWKLGQRRQGK